MKRFACNLVIRSLLIVNRQNKGEIDEDEETIEQNILFEIEEVHGGESGESEVMDLTKGSYVIGCLIPGHYEAGMKGTLLINP